MREVDDTLQQLSLRFPGIRTMRGIVVGNVLRELQFSGCANRECTEHPRLDTTERNLVGDPSCEALCPQLTPD